MGQNKPGRNSNEEVLYISQTPRVDPNHQMQFK